MDFNSKKSVDKHRLFITLFDRYTTPSSFHFALLLSPKGSEDTRSIAFHVTNILGLDNIPQQGKEVPWRYRKYTVNPHMSSSLVAKILVAKLPSSDTEDLQYWGDLINNILSSIPVPNSKTSNCRTWTFTALLKLSDEGREYFTSIPRFFPTGTGKLEEDILRAANDGRERLLKYGLRQFSPVELDIRKQKDYAT
ncbi:hypothetical protein HYPSUDRAFT_194187 [Hypholoma sublateritium FD-334 SS-4]|uniref:Uncharacterized protein n=1 Tax=Hypholoma sublateritium (strain FD-334 SS-4) TaxID=945553 RepID=A0A0D2KLN8_HYPSF|nr:hypothetical protein HYPSUDRAFT_194187 [Hypholoma sublateritium FD-334 SS-4]